MFCYFVIYATPAGEITIGTYSFQNKWSYWRFDPTRIKVASRNAKQRHQKMLLLGACKTGDISIETGSFLLILSIIYTINTRVIAWCLWNYNLTCFDGAMAVTAW